MAVHPARLELLGALGAALLTVAAVAAPSLADGSVASSDYTCNLTAGAAMTPHLDYSVNAAPATMAVRQPLTTFAGLLLDVNTTDFLQTTFQWVSFNGTIRTSPSTALAGLSLKIPKTPLGNDPDGTTGTTASGATLAGTTPVDSFTFELGDLGDVVLNGYDAHGHLLDTLEFPGNAGGPCTDNAGTSTLMSGAAPVTVKLVKDATTTRMKASYASRTHTAKGRATVASTYGTRPTGTVKFTLRKGTTIITRASATLNKKGIARTSFTHVKKSGTYSITGRYTGSTTLKGSSGRAAFTVQ